MPELPDLEVIAAVLCRRVVGQRIVGVKVLRPLVLRPLSNAYADPAAIEGLTIRDVARRHKTLLFSLDGDAHIAINCMLAGRLRLCPSGERVRVRTYVAFSLENGEDLRYHDVKGMGKVYLTDDLAAVPGLADAGIEPLDPELTLDLFLERLKRHRGEIKGVLTRGLCVAGIGNAYADEILFRARLYPLRKRTSLSQEEQAALYTAMRETLTEAIATLTERVGEDIHIEVRDFLAVHNKKGQPCPHCGQAISEIKVARRATSFCRRCQPGTMFRG